MNDKITFDLDTAFLPFKQAKNRALYFSKIALDKAESREWADNCSVTVNGVSHVITTPDEQSIERVNSLFPKWIIGHLICELIESFYYGYDNLYWFLLLAQQASEGKISSSAIVDKKKMDVFLKSGGDRKIERIKNEFGISFSKQEYALIFGGIKEIRDALTHRYGRVDNRVGQPAKNQRRKVSWYAWEFYYGDKQNMKPIELGKVISNNEGETSIIMKIVLREKTFDLGEGLFFTREELYEITDSLSRLVADIKQQVGKVATDMGIPFSEKKLVD